VRSVALEERSYAALPHYFTRDLLDFQLEEEIGGGAVLDGWR
jgi:hypothetical protein